MSKQKFKSNKYDGKKRPTVELSHLTPSMTIPNETYSLKDLVKKHKQGIMPPVERRAIWQGDATHDDIDLQKVHDMDIADQHEIIQQNNSIIKQLKRDQEEIIARRTTEEREASEGSGAERKATRDAAEADEAQPDEKQAKKTA